VFLALSRLEGFGLTPLEAMAAGCVVVGFTGIGGREYATAGNGFWVGEDDFPVCIDQLKAAIDLSQKESQARDNYFNACTKTLANYTPEIFRQKVKDVWAQILGSDN
jgi:glycosyltransferase involved in cell wall biosynthesis